LLLPFFFVLTFIKILLIAFFVLSSLSLSLSYAVVKLQTA